MLKRWGIGIGIFIALLAIAYPFIRESREHNFVLAANGEPLEIVYFFSKTVVGGERQVDFTFSQKNGKPFLIKKYPLWGDSNFAWKQPPQLGKMQSQHHFSIVYYPKNEQLDKSVLNLDTDQGAFLIDLAGNGIKPHYRIEKISLDGRAAAISWSNRIIYFSHDQIPQQWRMEYWLSTPGTIVWNGRAILPGEAIPFDGNLKKTIPIEVRFADGERVTYSIQATSLPIIELESPQLSYYQKASGYFSYFSPQKTVQGLAASLRIRGDTSKNYIKKPFKVNLLSTKRKKRVVEKNIQLGSLRKDGDWLFDPSYVDRTFIRNRLANDLYLMIAPNEQVINSEFVELIWNNAYQGVYMLNERIDRKQLGLDPTHGRLIKRRSITVKSPFAFGAIDRLPNYDGYSLQFPRADLMPSDVIQFLKFSKDSSDAQFTKEIHHWLDIDKTVDYHIWCLALAVTDSGHKNYFIAKRNQGGRFFFVPWDSDVSLGLLPWYQRSPIEQLPHLNPILSRLWALNPDGYREKVKTRWWQLRKGPLNNQMLTDRIDHYTEILYRSDSARRNFEAIKYDTGKDEYLVHLEDIQFIRKWIPQHLAYIDSWLKTQ